MSLLLRNITVRVRDREIVRGVSLEIQAGEIHALLGPNGSGKSSLAYALFGHPEYAVSSGSFTLDGIDLLSLNSEERARAGMFLSFQEPPEVGGVAVQTFLRSIGTLSHTEDAARTLGLDRAFFSRFLNEGFSGGEKKKSEVLQFLARGPKFAIFDEVDSGLDAGALPAVAEIILAAARKGTGIFLITHSPKFLSLVVPRAVYHMSRGSFFRVGGEEVISEFEKKGYEAFTPLDPESFGLHAEGEGTVFPKSNKNSVLQDGDLTGFNEIFQA